MKYLISVFATLTLATGAMAQNNGYNTVEIVRVEPRMVTVYQQQCREIAVQTPYSSGNAAGGVLGAIAGAAIGNQLGGGTGRDIATAVGGVMGYQAGRGDSQPGGVSYRTQCDQIPVMTQRGETVTFRYRNRLFSQTFE